MNIDTDQEQGDRHCLVNAEHRLTPKDAPVCHSACRLDCSPKTCTCQHQVKKLIKIVEIPLVHTESKSPKDRTIISDTICLGWEFCDNHGPPFINREL